MKWKHTYICDETWLPYGSLAFHFDVGGKTYGVTVEYNKLNKYKRLRELVLNKHSLISAFYEELAHHTQLAAMDPSSVNIAKVKELANAILIKREESK